jgi:ribosomal protein S18 acetylase RimI-like enzyme
MTVAATTNEVRIRPGRLEDAQAIANLATQLGYPSTPDQIAPRLLGILSHPDQALLVAELPGAAACGFIHLLAGMSVESGPRVEILALVTDENLRSRGIGRRLVAEAERWAQARGFAVICVRSQVKRTDAHRFYEGLGFECVKTQKYFRKSLPQGGEATNS